MDNSFDLDIAVIGMDGVFPGADNIEQFWENLCHGVESVREIDKKELIEKGVPLELLNNPNYVRFTASMEEIENFDAAFFDISPNEARSMDPQQRIFLQCCWRAFENAGYNPSKFPGDIALFAGCAMNTYLNDVLRKNSKFMDIVSQEQLMIGNDKDFLPTLASYKMNLTGASINVNTACSTGLVALHEACNCLLLNECDMALAGGVSLLLPFREGYLYKKDGILSSDGHCRAFDENAKGTIWGDACGILVLKRLKDAIRDHDQVLAVIKGSAVNNDGSNKVGYTAPSVEGQSGVIAEAMANAGIEPEDITYLEAHGTGTSLGDFVEISALKEVFEEKSDTCYLGSVKSNIGHTNTAAGIVGIIKCILAIVHKKIPPQINFEQLNSNINLDDTPFKISNELVSLNEKDIYMAVSSMGIGGTNSHVILGNYIRNEEKSLNVSEKSCTLVFSANSVTSLEQMIEEYISFLKNNSDVSLQNIAYTLQCGRKHFKYRKAIQCQSVEEAIEKLERSDWLKRQTGLVDQWLNGEDVEFDHLWQNINVSKVTLPRYPFEKNKYWVEPDEKREIESNYYEKAQQLSDWFYQPIWKQELCGLGIQESKSERWVVFINDSEEENDFCKDLRVKKEEVFMVKQGRTFQRDSNSIVMDGTNESHYKELADILYGFEMTHILYLWGRKGDFKAPDHDLDKLLEGQNDTFFAIMKLIQALGVPKQKLTLLAVTEDVYNILGDEIVNVESSTIAGVFTVLQQEVENILCGIVDVDDFSCLSIEKIDQIGQDEVNLICAYRKGKRYIREFQHVRVDEDMIKNPIFEVGKSYLLYSGMEGISYSIAKHILMNTESNVLIMEEPKFPERAYWNQWLEEMGDENQISQKIHCLKELCDLGAKYIGTIEQIYEDKTDLNNMEHTYGEIKGVIHGAGASGVRKRGSVLEFDLETWKEHFNHVAYSLLELNRFLQNAKLDFKISISGLVSILGGYGSVSIATLANYVKNYANRTACENGVYWTVQCWDASETVWGKMKQYLPDAMYDLIETVAITEMEGIEAFQRSLAFRDVTEVDISATDLNRRHKRWIGIQKDKKGVTAKLRPELSSEYKEASDSNEEILISMFSELLGIEGIGVNDDFFELGGHSLLGVQLITRLRDSHGIDFDLPILYKYPTVTQLALHIKSL